MAMQIRRGTDAERQLFIPLQGEIIFTTDTKKLYVGDGTTTGGIAVDTVGGGGEPDGNTTYSISAETVSGGANLRLTGSDASTDNVKLAAGSNVTISRTDADTITIAATGDGGAVQLNELTDVVITGTPSTGQVLKYDGTNWVNGTDATGGGEGGGATTLDELTDVIISGTPVLDQVLKYNGVSWVNDTLAAPSLSIEDLTDIGISEVADGDVLRYDEILETWVNSAIAIPSLDDISNVDIDGGSLSAGQSLVYDGVSWVNDTVTESLDSLTDVVITDVELVPGVFSLEEGMALVYNGTEWVNQYVTLDSLSDVEIDSLSLTAGQSLKYNGVSWTNDDLTLDDLSDVNYNLLNANDILYWDGTEWTNQRFTIITDDLPQLGGDLDLNNFDITGTGNVDIIGTITTGSTTVGPEGIQLTGLEGINISTELGPDDTELFNISTFHSQVRSSHANFTRARGNIETPLSLIAGNDIFAFNYLGKGSDDFGLAARIAAGADPNGTIGTDIVPGIIKFLTAGNDGVLRNNFSIDRNGQLGLANNTAIAGSNPGEVDDSAPVTFLKVRIGSTEYAIPLFAINT